MSFGFAPRLSGVYATTCVMIGINMPFFPLWLDAKGLDAGMIGLILAVPQVMRAVAIPTVARTADRRDAIREAIVILCWASLAGYALVGLASGPLAILLVYALASLVYTPIMPLIEAYALKGLGARGHAYGPVRLWGSVAFIVGTFLAGFAADLIPARHFIWVIVASAGLMALNSFSLASIRGEAPLPSDRSAAGKSLLRDPACLVVLAAASLIQASHAVYYSFSTLAWRAQGFDGTTIAALWTIGVVAEIVLFALQSRLPAMFTPTMLLMTGAVGGALRWSAMAFDPPAVVLPMLQVLHALSFGAVHLGAVTYLARRTPAGQGAAAQGYLAVALGLAMAAATGLSGLMFEAFGAGSYMAMALAAVAGGVCAAVAHRSRRVTAL